MRWLFLVWRGELNSAFGWGKPSPRGYCVRRYPFEREVSRNALNFQAFPSSGQPAPSRRPTFTTSLSRRFRFRRCPPPLRADRVTCVIPSA
jgi:hypothetical protein